MIRDEHREGLEWRNRQAMRQRSKHGKGMSVLPLAESNLGGCLTFTTQQEKKMYKDISKRKILLAKYIHYPTLEKLNVKDNFDSLIDKIGLHKFVDVDCLGHVELIREFYATFQFNIPNDFALHTLDVIKFRLMGRNFSRTKHIEIRHHFSRYYFQNWDITLEFVSTEKQLADIFTKPLSEEQFIKIRHELGMMKVAH